MSVKRLLLVAMVIPACSDRVSLTTADAAVVSPDAGLDGSPTDVTCSVLESVNTSCLPQEADCNIMTNAGCACGSYCYSTAGGVLGASCIPVPGTGGWGDACQFNYDCGPGFSCVMLSGHSACMMLCCGADHTHCRDLSSGGRPGAACIPVIADGKSTPNLCDDTQCDPFATTNNGCSRLFPYCVWRDRLSNGGIPTDVTTVCFERGDSPANAGAACTGFENNCPPGYACINGTCGRLCNPTARSGPGATCSAGMRCAGLSGFTDRGFCTR